MEKWYVDIYEAGIRMGIEYFKTKAEALEFIAEYGVKCFEIGCEVMVAYRRMTWKSRWCF